MKSRRHQRFKPATYLLVFSLFYTILFLILGFPHPVHVSQTHPNNLDPTFGIDGDTITNTSPLTELKSAVKQDAEEAKKVQIHGAYGNLPLSFIQNDGQVDKQVKFYEKGSGHATFFSQDGVYLSLGNGTRPAKKDGQELTRTDQQNGPQPKQSHIKLIPLGANQHPKIIAEGIQEGKVNYLIGNDPKKWKTNVPTYQAVVYQEVYPGIDLKFYGNNRQMEYDIIVKPGADPSNVKFAYEGIKGLRVTKEGDLEIGVNGRTILQKKPVIYQEINGRRVDLAGTFTIQQTTNRHPKRFAYGFEVASYDKAHLLVVDPTLVYSTYLGGIAGGNGGDTGYGIAVDGSGNAYVTGSTSTINFPTCPSSLPVCASTGTPLQAANGGGNVNDAFVTKFNATGSALVYSTYLGGSADDIGYGIAVDGSGNAYITGYTKSSNFPALNALQPSLNGEGDAFVTKLNAAGSALVYSTYLGGSGSFVTAINGIGVTDAGTGIAVDTGGNAYVTGVTSSANFPIAGSPFQVNSGGNADAFVAKFNAAGSALIYSTYLGGTLTENGNGIAVDTSGNAYITGTTASFNFPTANPLQASNNSGGGFCSSSWSAFVTKFNPAGSALVYSTYLGGNRCNFGKGIAVDGSGNAYVTGYTTSPYDFPTANALQNGCDSTYGYSGCYDVFVTKLNASGSVFIYSTYLGGSFQDQGNGIAVDGSGNAYVTGSTRSTNFPTCPSSSPVCATTGTPIQAVNGGGTCPTYTSCSDAFVAKFSPAGSALEFSTFLGGSGDDIGYGIAVDGLGNAFVTGQTGSTNFPTMNALQTNIHSNQDAFVAKIGNFTATIPAGASLCAPDYSSNCAYTPNPLTINSGQSVVWTSADGGILHTATSDDHADTFMLGQPVAPTNSFSTAIISGDTPSAAIGPFFNTTGINQTKLYHCSVHPAIMKGTLVIISAVVTTTTITTSTTTTTMPHYSPSADSLAPVNISTAPGSAQSFTASYSDLNGYMDISTASLTFWGSLFGMKVDYTPSTNKFTMAGADGTCTPGQAAALSDGYLTLNCGASTISGSGTILTVTYNVTPLSPISGTAYQQEISVMDHGGASDNKTAGTWTVNRPPSAGSLTPMNSMTDPMMSQMFTAVYSDPDSWQNIAAANLYFSGNGGMHNEWLHYLPAPNLFTMMGTNDFCSPGQAKTLTNGYLTLDCSMSSISGSGTTLTVIFQVTPQMYSSGIQYNIFSAASDQAGAANAIFAGSWQIQ